MRRFLLGALALGAVLACALPGSAQTLRVAIEGAYPPFQYVTPDGKLAGFDVDVVEAVCRAMRADCEFVKTAWDDLLPGLDQGKYEFVAASMGKRPDREKLADFTNSYYHSRCVFLGPKGDRAPMTLDSLRGRTISTQKGTVYARWLEKNFSAGARLELSATMTEAFGLLVEKKADYCLTDTLTGYEFLKSDPGRPFAILGDPVPLEEIPSPGASFQVKRGDEALRARINEAIRTIWLDGTYAKINARYFPFSIY